MRPCSSVEFYDSSGSFAIFAAIRRAHRASKPFFFKSEAAGPNRTCESLSGETAVENIWEKLKINMAWYVFGSRAEERGTCQPVYMALCFRSFRAILSGAIFLVHTRS